MPIYHILPENGSDTWSFFIQVIVRLTISRSVNPDVDAVSGLMTASLKYDHCSQVVTGRPLSSPALAFLLVLVLSIHLPTQSTNQSIHLPTHIMPIYLYIYIPICLSIYCLTRPFIPYVSRAPYATHQTTTARMFRVRVQCRLYREMHCSLWANYTDTLRGYWLHGNILGKIHDGKIILNEQIYRLPCVPSECLSDSVHNPHSL
jgi:hypothetical protein